MSTICTKIKDAEEEANYLLKKHYPKPPKKNHSRLKHLNALKDDFENIITVERKLRSSFSPNTSIKLNGVLNANLTNANAQVEPRFEPNKVTRTYKKKRPTISNGSAPKLNTDNLLSVEQSLLPSLAPNALAKNEEEELKIKQEILSPTKIKSLSVIQKRLNLLIEERNSFIDNDSKILGKRRSLDRNLRGDCSQLNSSVESCLDTSVKFDHITLESNKDKTLDVTSTDQEISFDSGINQSNKIDSTVNLVNDIKIKTENNNYSAVCEDAHVELNEIDEEEKIVEVKRENEYNLGDLCWARIGKSPFWPCIITTAPNSSNFQRNILKKYSIIVFYHVRFFGDNGRRSWIHILSLMPFSSKNDLELLHNTPKPAVNRKSLSNYVPTVPPKQLPKWTVAVEEAESVKNFPPEIRILEFEAIVANVRADKLAIRRKNASVRRTFAESIKKEAENLEELAVMKKIKLEVEESEEEAEDVEIVEEKKVLKVDLTITPTIEHLTELYGKKSLFSKVGRDKVCHVCAKRKNLVKCKGKCGFFYHKACTQIKVKAEFSSDIRIKQEILDGNEECGYTSLSLNEQIDFKLQEIMKDSLNTSYYPDSDDCVEVFPEEKRKVKKRTRHVCADSSINSSYEEEVFIKTEIEEDDFKCNMCLYNTEPNCFVCGEQSTLAGTVEKVMCSVNSCTHYFHLKCLKFWPQTQWNYSDRGSILENSTSFICPAHVCHTCISEAPDQAASRFSDKMARCLLCPAAYHSLDYCIPAGTQIFNSAQILCPRHYGENKIQKVKRVQRTINTTWCVICARGGNLVCCETCPTSVHSGCLPLNLTEDDRFICEDCESGRFPLYGEIVWTKLGSYRWWPAVILFPHEIPLNIQQLFHNDGEFVVKFFGTYNHYWVSRCRTFLFQEGDKGVATAKKRVDAVFLKAVTEATAAYNLKNEFKANKTNEFSRKLKLKPPPYQRITKNRPVGKVKYSDSNLSNVTACDCNPNEVEPCGPDSNCLNRILMTECNPELCPAGKDCKNQRFEKKEYPKLLPYKTQGRGWGLKTLVAVQRGQFVIEYVGEVINEAEYLRRVDIMHKNKVENYYFLVIDHNRLLDAGPKGNVARFMNHSCEPNCETQKWTVNGETRVGLFAVKDIPADTELTFNYNLECIGKEKKICTCGAAKCSGFIGVKIKTEEVEVKPKVGKAKSRRSKKRKPSPKIVEEVVVEEPSCFVCGGQTGHCIACMNKQCNRYYHLECIDKGSVEVNKFICPSHNCNICMKRTIRSCVHCLNSYCPQHSNGNIRFDFALGYICTEHDPVNIKVEKDENESNM